MLDSAGYRLVAALLLTGIGLAHSYLGERYILIRLFRQSLPPIGPDDVFTKRVLRFAWHLTSVAWWGFAAVLLLAPSPAIGAVVALTFFIHGLVVLLGSRGRHRAWPLFLVVAALAWLGTR